MSFFPRPFSDIFAIAKQLLGFSISRLATVENFLMYKYLLKVNIHVSINDYLFEHI